ncbi:class I SAM-dependent methyltransferase [Mycobacterium sp. MYCO198283]|uniref:class I SAM-dependent methyltransferase n=1 Tax=Mycobacterium sp. MYCO198283 TaxID=2883505 RepID=UPI001E60516D|nr:class I SAM-dependent methyltransferase [Mycobacterium sp. MYCO198283]MCG5432464.1 class I SAM-dependent methyltransferase [Mycobacterium sp. MYCO198283]
MRRHFRTYRNVGHRLVDGWMCSDVLSMIEAVDDAQRTAGVTGAVAEIGVHHGKLFIGLKLLQDGGRAVAIDVFEDQSRNVDGSGEGDRTRFLANVARWSDTDGLVVHQGDSTLLAPPQLRELAGGPVRIISVDGGHTAETVHSDLRLAEATLADGGVVVADDVFNHEWPGVITGTLAYLEGGGAVAPFAIGFNKVLFSQPHHCARYRDAVVAAFGDRPGVHRKRSYFAGHEVEVLSRATPTPREVLRRSSVARSVYELAVACSTHAKGRAQRVRYARPS